MPKAASSTSTTCICCRSANRTAPNPTAFRRSPRRCPARASKSISAHAILQEMWEKWAFIATGAGITCLMRASFGDIVTAGFGDLTTTLYDECRAIAKANGFPPGEANVKRSLGMFTSPTSVLTASMMQRHRTRRADRRRPRGRQFAATRRRRPRHLPALADRLCAPEILRGAAQARKLCRRRHSRNLRGEI